LVLFDEIEKAHPDTFNMLLQILEDGMLTDAKGRKIDFTNTIVIMTSNIGAEKLQKEANFGFHASSAGELKDLDSLHESNKDKVLEELKKAMRPELLNRIDKTIVFHALTKKDIYRIVDLQIDELRARLQRKGLGIQLTNAAKQYLLDKGYDPKNGVRPLRRIIQDTIEDHIADKMLSEAYDKGHIVQVSAKNSELAYSVTAE
jgi:ATP-dependent Clp protease ATP-binding subunit ClpC